LPFLLSQCKKKSAFICLVVFSRTSFGAVPADFCQLIAFSTISLTASFTPWGSQSGGEFLFRRHILLTLRQTIALCLQNRVRNVYRVYEASV